MPDRQPQAWGTNAEGSFPTLEREPGVIEVWALGEDRFTVKTPERKRLVVGFEAARQTYTS